MGGMMPKGPAEREAVCPSAAPSQAGLAVLVGWWSRGAQAEGQAELHHQSPAPCTPLPELPEPLLSRTQPQPCKPGQLCSI